MSTTEVGVAYVRLLPSMDGFKADVVRELGDGLTKPAQQAGEDAGKAIAKGIEDGAKGADFDGVTSGIGDKLKLGLAGAGLAGGALLMEGLTSAMDLEATTDKLEAQLGDSKWAESAGTIAGNLYKSGFGETVADTGEAVKKIIQAGLSPDLTDEALQKITGQFLTFTDVLDQDMDMTVQSVQSMFTSGIASSGEEALDVLTAGIQLGADKAGDFAEVFQEYSTNFREAGLSAADAAGLMVQGLDAGARDADKVADAIKEFGIRAQDGSKASADGFKAIGLSAEDMTAKVAAGGPAAREALGQVLDGLRNIEDPAARSQAAVALFGTQAEDLGDALYALDLTTAADNLGSFAGKTDELGSAYDNASSKIESFKRTALMELTEFVGNTVLPALEGFAGWVTDTFGPTFDTVRDSITTLIAAFQEGESFGGGGIFDFMGELGATARDVYDDVMLFWGALTTGMTEDEGTPIESVALAIRDAFQQAQPIVDAFSAAWQSFSGYLEEHGELVAGAVGALAIAIGVSLVGALVAMAVSAAAAIAPFLLVGIAVAAVGAGIMWLWENVDGFRTFVEEAAPAIGEVFSSAFDLISVVVSSTVDTIRTIWNLWGEDIMSVTTAVFGVIGSVITNGLQIISGIIKLVTALIQGDWGAAWDAVKQIVTANLAIVQSVISGTMQIIRAIVSAAWTAIVALFGSQIETIKNSVSNGLNAVVNFFRNLPGQISSAMSTVASAITNPFRSAFSSLKSLWNSTVGGFGFTVPSWIPGVGGKGFTIPKMHTGGIFDAPGGEGLALLKAGEGVFTPDQMRALGTGTAAAGASSTTVVIEADDRRFKEWLRYTVRTEAGGSAEEWFGQN